MRTANQHAPKVTSFTPARSKRRHLDVLISLMRSANQHRLKRWTTNQMTSSKCALISYSRIIANSPCKSTKVVTSFVPLKSVRFSLFPSIVQNNIKKPVISIIIHIMTTICFVKRIAYFITRKKILSKFSTSTIF